MSSPSTNAPECWEDILDGPTVFPSCDNSSLSEEGFEDEFKRTAEHWAVSAAELDLYEADVVDTAQSYLATVLKGNKSIGEYGLVLKAAHKSSTWLSDVFALIASSDRVERVKDGTFDMWRPRQTRRENSMDEVMPAEDELVRYFYDAARRHRIVSHGELETYTTNFATDPKHARFQSWYEQ
ncbi:Aste57867_23603 [Aphanomyces stellatus]|uniref:Aste57867_23603 protein n=1 Tax=Aphanomyces stellatus TaxID=120398 RepID=A0A485LN43_9STRA|nr:hypothetical protein As57867_023531 [Aphanomyces stellatus]VFU00248.1 Aste57867_23603 [Aphanomyces stellatus]